MSVLVDLVSVCDRVGISDTVPVELSTMYTPYLVLVLVYCRNPTYSLRSDYRGGVTLR